MKRHLLVKFGNGNGQTDSHVFRLYLTGASPNSSKAIVNLKKYFEKHLRSRYKLHVVDVYQQPHVAQNVDIIALPLLVREFPLPQRRLIGDMSDEGKIIKSLGLTSE